MPGRRGVLWPARGLPLLLALACGPALARAHEVAASRFTAPLPLPLLFGGAAVTVAFTAVWLAISERGDAPPTRRRRVLRVPTSVARPSLLALRATFSAMVVAAVVAGVVGRQVAAENVATVFTWPVWFRGLALLAVLVGTPWRLLSPWRTVYRALVRLEGRTIAVFGEYPSTLGEWPAVVGFLLLLGVIENLTVIPESPRLTTAVLAVYAIVMVGGATLYGTPWLKRVDPLEVFYRLFGRVAPINVHHTDEQTYSVTVRPPWRGCVDPVESLPLAVFVIAMVYTVSFDGFTNTRRFRTLLFTARDTLDTGASTSILLYIAGFASFILAFGVVSWVIARLGSGDRDDWVTTARWFAPTVLPIAAAYEVAHNYPYVIRNVAQLVVISLSWIRPELPPITPLGWLSLTVFWSSQVVLIVLGHIIAVVAAHYVARHRYESPVAARRGHLPLVILMVGYTVLSLWIISQPVISR